MLSSVARANIYLKFFGFFKVPFIWLTRAKVLRLDESSVEIKIPLKRKTKNHLNSMYFGALAIGADVAGGFMAMTKAKQNNMRISLAFKHVEGRFIQRAESDVHFICDDGAVIDKMLATTMETGERVNESVRITSVCPAIDRNQAVAEFDLTLSVKRY